MIITRNSYFFVINFSWNFFDYIYIKVKWSSYRPGVAQRVDRGIALLFHDRGTRRGWVVSSTSRPHFTPEKDSVPILQEAGWAPGPVWTGEKSHPYRDSIPDRPARSSVTILTELHGPQLWNYSLLKYRVFILCNYLAVCVSSWQLAVSSWQLAVSSWQLAVGN